MNDFAQTTETIKRFEASQLKVVRLQMRDSTSNAYVAELAECMTAGDKFPPITVVSDGSTNWLVDGAHRLDAAINSGQAILVKKIPGNRKKAVELACGANRTHGLRRTNADKRNAVTLALKELGCLSDREIAKLCGVSNKFVGDVRRQVCTEHTSNTKRVGADGKDYPAKPRRTPSPQDPAGFDPKSLEKEPSSKPPKSGTSFVSPKQREECESSLGRLIRNLEAVGIYNEFLSPLDQIAERIKQL